MMAAGQCNGGREEDRDEAARTHSKGGEPCFGTGGKGFISITSATFVTPATPDSDPIEGAAAAELK
jgi:hypothetical protein